ncbi:uncharacterized protein DS421_12g360360 [Arachis hypogaea]|nr:uncharacterized protein DS421_12g360360 [Arachis hypogaea]
MFRSWMKSRILGKMNSTLAITQQHITVLLETKCCKKLLHPQQLFTCFSCCNKLCLCGRKCNTLL